MRLQTLLSLIMLSFRAARMEINMKQKITILLLISVLLIANTGCKKKEINKPESTTEISKKDKIPKISKKELSAMKKKAKRELKLHDKKIGNDSWQEFIEKHTADGDVEKYSLDNIVILEGYEKDSSVADLVVFAKKKEKWKFLYVFK